MKRRWFFSVAAVAAAAIVAAAALLPRPGPAGTAAAQPSGEPVIEMAVSQTVNGEHFSGQVRLTYSDPDTLPASPADVSGLYLGRSGDVLTVGTGPVEVTVDQDVVNDNEPVTTVRADYGGDELSVRITDETQILVDETARPEITPEVIDVGHLQIERQIQSGSLAALADNMEIRAWGTMQDGVLVADVLVYKPIR